MEFVCTVKRLSTGEWSVQHHIANSGVVDVRAASREAALEKMRRELRYRLELSPCCGEAYKDVPIELVETR
ncbi:MAG: hypothetical protein ACT4QC_13130 [Planctomycetaceae bacterium]